MSCECNTFIGPPLTSCSYGGSYILFMAIVNNLITKNCRISEICERVTPKLKPDDEYDFVIIGGGSGGSVAGGRLSEYKQWKVLVIEAGHDEPATSEAPSISQNNVGNPEITWNYYTEPQKEACLGNSDRRCAWIRGKLLGGCGSINGMMYMRGVPRDYDDWAKMGNPGWEYSNLVDDFKKSENNLQIGSLVKSDIHGTGGPITVSRFPYHPPLADDLLKAAKAIGSTAPNDLNEPPYNGFSITQMNVKNGARVSSARAYLRPARHRSNLHIMVNSTVTRIILESTPQQKNISRVEFIYNNQVFSVKVKKEAIVAAGTINSPQILLLSGIGPKDVLDKVQINQTHNLPGTGQNLHNHVAFSVYFNLNLVKDVNDLNWLVLRQYLTTQTGPIASTGMGQVTARLVTKYANYSDQPDLQLFFHGFQASCSRKGETGELEDPTHPDTPKSFMMSAVCLHPKSRGSITLKSSNPLEPPLINPNYLTNDLEVKTLIEGVRVIQKLSNTKILKEKYGIEINRTQYGDCEKNNSYDSDEFWECAIRYSTGPENHQAGSCKMGPSTDPLAVVNSKLEVHGIEGLRIMDASVMPKVVSGNTHTTVVLIAEKGVNYIKEKWL